MIRKPYIEHWFQFTPWAMPQQVEQDLVITRALVEIFRVPELRDALAFRGGTALSKLHFDPPHRYSEDIDLVQIRAEPIGETMKAIRRVLDPWLGKSTWQLKHGRVVIYYRFESDGTPPTPLRLKIEINSREHFAVFPLEHHDFSCDSPWFSGAASITTFALDELLGTKLRALYQRKKGRDLFDMAFALRLDRTDPERILEAFSQYMQFGGNDVSRAQFEKNIHLKLMDLRFANDVKPLLADGRSWSAARDAALVSRTLVERLPGRPWKGVET